MKALIAMSGGVDSSVAASLIREKGIEAVGCTMILHDNGLITDPREKACGSSRDIEDARNICEKLGMEHQVLDYRQMFRETVMKYFVESYKRGQTPNPCVACNKQFKFHMLMEHAKKTGCELVVTGHYAQIEKTSKGYVLRKAADESKDQSYVLYNFNQRSMAHTLLPLGGFTKAEIRKMAEERGFINARKKDSQDICFIPDGDYGRFIEEYTGEKGIPGDFVDMKGKPIGKHDGIIHYTIGQRKGLGQGFGKRIYVCSIDAENNRVVLGDNKDLFSKKLKVSNFNWLSGNVPFGKIRCQAKVRYNQTAQPATVVAENINTVSIEFDEPQRAVTPGQSAVLYNGDIVLGGGIIGQDYRVK